MSDVSEAKVTVNIRILDNEFQVSCAENEVEDLKASAQDVDRRMREIRDAGGTLGLERIAVLAALNLSHDNLRRGRQQQE
ncbi:MAG: cell division protein ZapA, partial [Pseudomonadales bacterium]|nr:cell division protein ZapA [Pseudomonadales bacterium]